MIQAAVTAYIGHGVSGEGAGIGKQWSFTRGFVHAIVGGVSAEVDGGKFGHGFISSAISSGADGVFNLEGQHFITRVVANAVIAGTISEVTGGKFANGAISAAFRVAFGEFRSKLISNEGSSPIYSGLEKNRRLSKRGKLKKTENSLTFNLTASHDPAVSPLTADEYFAQIEKNWSLSVDGNSIKVNIEMIGVEESQKRFKADLHLQMCEPDICTSGLGAAEAAGRRMWYSSIHLMLTPTHEFGHILGFTDNVAGGRGSIMGPGSFKPPLIRSVTSEDFNQIFNLYND